MVALALVALALVILAASAASALFRTPRGASDRGALGAEGAPATTQAPSAADAGFVFAPIVQRQRGVALGLFAEDVSFDYRPLLDEIAKLGATHVALVVPMYQEHGASTALALHTRFSPTLTGVLEAVRAARGFGLEVTLFPIVRLTSPRDGEWRGTLKPSDVDAWFRSYGSLLGDLASIAASAGASRLVVGSELSTLDVDAHVPRWTALIARVRGIFHGALLYSANWDHFRDARVLDLVDEAGVTGYFQLRRKAAPVTVAALEAGWRGLRADLEGWLAGRPSQPFIFTELGYRSRVGASATPWDETGGGVVDLEEQRAAFEAFRRAWAQAPSLHGYYVWNWYGFGGATSTGYTPRGKPAAAEVKRLLEAP